MLIKVDRDDYGTCDGDDCGTASIMLWDAVLMAAVMGRLVLVGMVMEALNRGLEGAVGG